MRGAAASGDFNSGAKSNGERWSLCGAFGEGASGSGEKLCSVGGSEKGDGVPLRTVGCEGTTVEGGGDGVGSTTGDAGDGAPLRTVGCEVTTVVGGSDGVGAIIGVCSAPAPSSCDDCASPL
jgi:hypothetical protein